MGGEIPYSDWDWDYPLTDEALRAIDSAFSAATAPPPSPKRKALSGASLDSPPRTRRRLPDSLFVFQQQLNSKSSSFSPSPYYTNRSCGRSNSCYVPPLRDIKFGGRIVYSRTMEEVERAAEELVDFVEAKKRKDGWCILGLDIEWKPTFRRGVAPGKVAVMQLCGDHNCCFVLHIIHSQIPKSLQCLLEDPACQKVGVCIASDAAKVLQDYSVSINNLGDLSDTANRKLGGEPKRWSLSTLTETLICRKLPKPNKIRLGNWEVEVLSKEQLSYAATDAYVSWFLYQVLKTFPDPADNKSVEKIAIATPK